MCIPSLNDVNSKKHIFFLFLHVMIKFYRNYCPLMIVIPNDTYEKDNETQSNTDTFYWKLD